MGLIDSYAFTNGDNDYSLYDSVPKYGQSFTGNGATLGSIVLHMRAASNPVTGNVTVKVYGHSGTYGTSSVSDGNLLATSDSVAASSIPYITETAISFAFTGGQQITLTNGTNYVFFVEWSGMAAATYLGLYMDMTSSTHGGNMINYNNTALSSYDLVFEVRDNVPEPTKTNLVLLGVG